MFRPGQISTGRLTAFLTVGLTLVVGMAIGVVVQGENKAVPGHVEQVALERFSGSARAPGKIEFVVIRREGALLWTSIILDGRTEQKSVCARAISAEDFRGLEELVNRSRFFEREQPVVVPDTASVRIKALRGDEQHAVECNLSFQGAPPLFREIVSSIDRLVAPLMSDDDKAANRPAKGNGTTNPE